MKKIILSVVFVFALGSFSLLNASPTNSYAVTSDVPDCWAAADSAEADFCGSVGCSFDFWAGFYEGCSS